MTTGEAHDIASEQIERWQAERIGPADAWSALGQKRHWSIMWWEVRRFMVGWLLFASVPIDSAADAHIMRIERGPAGE